MARILSVGSDRDILARRNRALAQLGHNVCGAVTRMDAMTAAKSQRFDIALVCNTVPQGYASVFAEELQALMPRTAVICIPDGEPEINIAQIDEMIQNTEVCQKAA